MSVIPTGMSEGSLGDLKVFGCSKIRFLLYLYVKLQNYEVWIAGKIIAQTGSTLLQLASRSKFLQLGSDTANFDYKAYPELAAGENQISVKSKLPHLASISDGHFVAGYQIWEGLGRIGSRWFWRPSNFESRWLWRPSRFKVSWLPKPSRFNFRWSHAI
jgi:hypothetical protein